MIETQNAVPIWWPEYKCVLHQFYISLFHGYFVGSKSPCVTYACTECIETWAEFLSYHLFSLPFFSSSLIRYFYFISQLHYKEHPVDYCLHICYLCGLFFFFPSVHLFVPYWAILAILSQILPWKPNSVTSQHSIFLLLDWLLIGKHMSTSLSLWSCSESALWLMSVFINDEFKCSLLPPPRGFQRLPSYLKIQ